MLKSFGARLSASQLPADLAASRNVCPLTLKLSGACWTRVLNEYLASNLLAASFSDRSELLSALLALTIATPLNLSITTADWEPVEDTVAIAPVPGVPSVPPVPGTRAMGRRGSAGYVPAVPAVPGVPGVPPVPGRPALDAALEYLAMVDVLDLEANGSAPWLYIAYLAGSLGPCLLQSERNRAASQVQISARAIAGGSHARFGTVAGDNHSLAGNLLDYLRVISDALPAIYLGPGLDPGLLRAETRDAVVYIRDDGGRRAVEESRVMVFAPMCAPPRPCFATLTDQPPLGPPRRDPCDARGPPPNGVYVTPSPLIGVCVTPSLAGVCVTPPPIGVCVTPLSGLCVRPPLHTISGSA